jgi:hypothetical protein
MPLAICIQHKLESEGKAGKVRISCAQNHPCAHPPRILTFTEQIRGLLDDIADVTFSHEPENKAYCWFRKSPDGGLEGGVAGFEMLLLAPYLCFGWFTLIDSRYDSE